MTTDGGDPTVARLLEGLLEGAEEVDAGSFSIDADEAARKREKFQYPDRSQYLIPIFEGLFGLGTKSARVSALGLDVDVETQGCNAPIDAEVLFRLGSARGVHADDPVEHALHRIAVGIEMGMGHRRVSEIVLDVGTPDERLIAEYRRDVGVRVHRKPPDPNHEGIRVLVERNLLGAGSESESTDSGNELDWLRDAIARSILDITISGLEATAVDRELDYVQRGSGPGFVVELGLARTGLRRTLIDVYSNGVVVDRWAGEGVGVEAELHFAQPRYDATRMGVVRGSRMEGALAEVSRLRVQALEALSRDEAEWGDWQRPLHWDDERVDAVLGREQASGGGPTVRRFAQRIASWFVRLANGD